MLILSVFFVQLTTKKMIVPSKGLICYQKCSEKYFDFSNIVLFMIRQKIQGKILAQNSNLFQRQWMNNN